MLGLTLSNKQLALRDDLPVPTPAPGEALVRVVRAGICSTDHGLVAGMYPYDGILGHEFVGVVESGPAELEGRRVVGEINATCGRCERCRTGLERHCAERTVLGIVGRDGAFAEHLVLPSRNLHVVPDAVTDAQAVYTEPLAAALEITEQVHIAPTDRVLLVGDGKLGQLVAQTLALTGCDLVVRGRHPHKLEHLARRGIAVSSAHEPLASAAGSFDVAVECTGNAAGFADARAALRPAGTLVLKSTYPGRIEVDATYLVVDEIRVVGSRCGPFVPALRLLASGRVDVGYLDDGDYPLRAALAAFERSGSRETLKITLTPGAD